LGLGRPAPDREAAVVDAVEAEGGVMSHTAGPWIPVVGMWNPDAITIIDSSHQEDFIAVVPKHFKNFEANARLIAACPDLLAALEAIVSPYGGVYGTLDIIEQAKAAIAKAREKS
jgi:hypothetical protein